MIGNDLTITILDHGKPFNLKTVPAPNLTAELEDRACGGLGVYIIRQLMDRVDYKSSKTGNTWKIIKTKKY
jgi:serine/threonine-protein kinase RsbW